MRYKESMKTSLFILFVFISGVILYEILRSGKTDTSVWQSLLPKGGKETFSFIVALVIILNTLNWCIVYFISLFQEKIWQRTDYPFLILSLALAIAVVIRLVSSGIVTDRFFLTLAAGVFSVYNIYQYWLGFKKKKTEQSKDLFNLKQRN